MSSRSKRKGRSRRSLDHPARKDAVMAEEGAGRVDDSKGSPVLARTVYSPPLKTWAWTPKRRFDFAILAATCMAALALVVGFTSARGGGEYQWYACDTSQGLVVEGLIQSNP